MGPEWIGVIGATVGGGLVFMAARYTAIRSETSELEHKRLSAYADFLAQTLTSRSPTQWIAVGRPAALLTRLQEFERSVARAYSLVNLLAGENVKNAADKLSERVRQDIKVMSSTVTMFSRVPETPGKESEIEFVELRIAFERAVRDELGIPA